METDITLTPEQIPPSFNRCFQGDCPKADSCAHFLAGKYLRKGQVDGPAVYPSARQGDKCVCYKQTRIIHAAYGFKSIFAEVKKKDNSFLRNRIMSHLGGDTAFYRFNRGDRLLTPEQQEWILALFRQRGYTEDFHFDGYCYCYDFT